MSNYGTIRKSTKALPTAVVIIIVISMFPATMLGWTADVADVFRIPVTPFSHVGMLIKSWVRPAIEPFDLPTDEKERNDLAIAERDQYRQLYLAQMLRSTELAGQLRIMQSLPETALRNPLPPLLISVDLTGIKPNDPSGTVELKLSRSAIGRVLEGDIAIIGRDIVGRISRVGITRMILFPSTHIETGYIRAAIVPAHPLEDDRAPLLAEILIQPTDAGFFTSEVPANRGIKENDLVILDDPSWPVSGKGLVLGVVRGVSQLDEAPLRNILTIEPRRRAREHTIVVVLCSGMEATE
ncbi:MAG TPA: hypothetical protein EYM90_00560 [Phycisphaerales bacterium]|nr:hypothetical protein [Phycisphaerales bacterium]